MVSERDKGMIPLWGRLGGQGNEMDRPPVTTNHCSHHRLTSTGQSSPLLVWVYSWRVVVFRWIHDQRVSMTKLNVVKDENKGLRIDES
jgi:hypothetical protein